MPTDQPQDPELKPSERPLLRANPLSPPEYGEGHRPLPNLAAIVEADELKKVMMAKFQSEQALKRRGAIASSVPASVSCSDIHRRTR